MFSVIGPLRIPLQKRVSLAWFGSCDLANPWGQWEGRELTRLHVRTDCKWGEAVPKGKIRGFCPKDQEGMVAVHPDG